MKLHSKAQKNRLAYLIIVAATTLITVPIALQLTLFKRPAIDEQTLCPSKGVQSRSVILLDKSDVWDRDDLLRVESLLKRIYAAVPAQSRLSIYGIVGVARKSTDVALLFDMCNPGSVEECNALKEDCRRMKKTYETAFDGPLKSLSASLKEPGQSSYSPLLEVISEVWRETEAQSLNLHVISDFMENGPRFRFYDVVPLDEEMVKEYPLEAKGAYKVFGHVIQRRRHSMALQQAVQRAWEGYFRQQGISAAFESLLITD